MGKKNVFKEFKLTNLAVNNRISVFVLMFIILILGYSTYQRTPKESFPEVKQPIVFVSTVYPGNSPKDMENLITRVIEQELNAIGGIEEITSISVQDYSGINIEFDVDEDITKAMQEVRDAIDRAKPDLPNDLPDDPGIIEWDISDMPIMFINLYGEVGEEMLKRSAEYLEEEIENISQIKDVELSGVREKVVNILLDQHKMQAANVTFDDIKFAIIEENVTMSAGDLLVDDYKRNLRIVGEFNTPKEIEDIVITNSGTGELKVGHIAKVVFGFDEPLSYAKMNGKPVVTLNVKKRTGENIIVAANKIQKLIAKAREDGNLDPRIEVEITGDQSEDTHTMIKDLESNIISGVILVVGVLMFFLGLRNALFVGIAIPLSMLMGIFLVGSSGNTLNMMVLFSLILALGMLVDNGIVVVENIYRLMGEGYSHVEAAKKGVGEIAWPIIASTATTLAAFFPLLFWGGIMGEFMKYFPITLILVLGASLLVALVINPVLTSSFMKIQDDSQPLSKQRTERSLFIVSILFFVGSISHLIGWYTLRGMIIISAIILLIFIFFVNPVGRWYRSEVMPRIENAYKRLLQKMLKGVRPHFIMGGTIVLLFFSMSFYFGSKPRVLFFPENIARYINVFIELPLGADIETTKAYADKIEKRTQKVLEPYADIIESIQTQVGENTSDPAADLNFGAENNTPHKARVSINFVEFKYRNGKNTNDLLGVIRNALADIPGAIITVSKNADGPPMGKPINLEIIGEDFNKLVVLAKSIRNELEALNVPGIEELKTNLEEGKPEVLIQIDRSATRRYGLSTVEVAMALRTALFGVEVSKYKKDDEDYEIWLRLQNKDRYNLMNLMNIKLPVGEEPNSGMLPLSAVVDLKYTSSYGSIRRKNLDRVITIFSNINEGYNATEINNELKKYMVHRKMPTGYSYRFTGEQEEQAETMSFLTFALAMAVLLIVLILVSQFNSVIIPFIIAASVLFSTIGVFLGLGIFKLDFIILMMMLGLISLAGIVVNNAIVLIDYTNLVGKRKKIELDKKVLNLNEIREVIVEGGKTRLRPVILTAITTILGLIPLAVGFNINFIGLVTDFKPGIYFGGDNVMFWEPMAWTIIFGLLFATFLTLFVVPIMYFLKEWFIRIMYFLKEWFIRNVASKILELTNLGLKNKIAK